MNEINDNEIIININDANKAQKYKNENELFQIDAFKDITNIFKEHKYDEDDSENITDCRFHNTIFIDGNRGVGKTAFMLNIDNYYNEMNKDTNKPKYKFLNPVDPTLLEHTEKFLSVILARVIESVNCEIEDMNDKSKLDKYFESLEELSKSLSAIKSLPDDIGIEEIASNKSSLKLEQNAHKFFKVVCDDIFNSKALIILIDDVDMAFDKGFDVLEVVRKYLASPYIIPIVAGDMKLYREIVETQFMDKIKFNSDINYLSKIYKDSDKLLESEEYKEKKKLLNNLVEQYLRKIFPNEYQLQLKDIYTIYNEKEINIKFDNETSVSIKNLFYFDTKHINLGINQYNFYFKTFSNNTRDFIQYLYSKKEIYYNFFKLNTISADINSIEYDKIILNFILKDEGYKKSLHKTLEFYKYSDDRKKKELSFLLQNDYDSFIEGEYSLYKAFSSDSFSTIKKFKLDNANDIFALQKNSLSDEINEKDSHYNDISNYIIDLFVYNNYYSSYQSRNYIYAGKFIDNIIFSLNKLNDKEFISEPLVNQVHNYIDKNIDFEKLFKDDNLFNLNAEIYTILYDSPTEDKSETDEQLQLLCFQAKELIYSKNINKINEYKYELKQIANKVPFGSDFSKNKSNYLKESDNSEEEEYNLKIDYDLTEYSKNLIIWQNLFIENIKLNSISMYEIIYKFFRNIEKIKDEFDLRHEKPIIYFRRVVLILINSIAYFETIKKNVANTNIAMNKNFNFNNILSKNSASIKNIQPMLKIKYSLTRALFFHPLISHILFTDVNSDSNLEEENNKNKLNRLKWQGKLDVARQASKIFNDIVKDIKSFGIDQKIDVLSKILKEKSEIIIEINKIQKFKKFVISASSDSNQDKQTIFNDLIKDLNIVLNNDKK